MCYRYVECSMSFVNVCVIDMWIRSLAISTKLLLELIFWQKRCNLKIGFSPYRFVGGAFLVLSLFLNGQSWLYAWAMRLGLKPTCFQRKKERKWGGNIRQLAFFPWPYMLRIRCCHVSPGHYLTIAIFLKCLVVSSVELL